MIDRFNVELVVDPGGADFVEVLASLMERLNLTEAGRYNFRVYGAHRSGGSYEVTSTGWLSSSDIAVAMAEARAIVEQRDPENCLREPCCRGLVRYHDKPVCQLSTEELLELTEAAAGMIPGRAWMLRRVVRSLTQKLLRNRS